MSLLIVMTFLLVSHQVDRFPRFFSVADGRYIGRQTEARKVLICLCSV